MEKFEEIEDILISWKEHKLYKIGIERKILREKTGQIFIFKSWKCH